MIPPANKDGNNRPIQFQRRILWGKCSKIFSTETVWPIATKLYLYLGGPLSVSDDPPPPRQTKMTTINRDKFDIGTLAKCLKIFFLEPDFVVMVLRCSRFRI